MHTRTTYVGCYTRIEHNKLYQASAKFDLLHSGRSWPGVCQLPRVCGRPLTGRTELQLHRQLGKGEEEWGRGGWRKRRREGGEDKGEEIVSVLCTCSTCSLFLQLLLPPECPPTPSLLQCSSSVSGTVAFSFSIMAAPSASCANSHRTPAATRVMLSERE